MLICGFGSGRGTIGRLVGRLGSGRGTVGMFLSHRRSVGRLGPVIREETFLPVNFLLSGNVDQFGLTHRHRLLPALLPLDVLTVRPRGRHTVGRVLHPAGEGVGGRCLVDQLRLVVPQLLLGAAGDLRHEELHLLVHQLTLLPGDWLAGVSARPHLE